MPERRFQRILPGLNYEDVAGAVEWLHEAFGFTEIEGERMAKDGRVWHAAMNVVDTHIMLSTVPGYESPNKHGGLSFQSLYVRVDDVDAHHARAVAGGARILQPPEDKFWGDRVYSALDLEGHQWHFAQHLRDVERYEPSEADHARHLG